MAIELARRGRAATICAFSPAGFWKSGDGFQQLAFGRLQRGIAFGRFTRPLLPVIYRSPTLRRLILRDIACHADRIPAARALEFIDDGIGCEVLAELCAAEWLIEILDPPPCPITVAWGEKETLLPAGVLGKIEPIPQASLKVLPDVGHVPMVDDPGLVARTILTTTGAVLIEDR